ncbi:prepilin-type N-terminal cleavage/methylation domain-containing protein [Clostridium sp.]|uniref:prepilin-type N-terminal cleavage/methylation domain-containing protein n=1 Tax=Clostridium sp. TaxID=1506 RepID=UPI003F3540E3
MKNKKKAFTLIELIIVIAVIAILAAIAIPKFGEVRRNTSIKADIANAKVIADATTVLLAEGKLTAPKDGEERYDLQVGSTEGESKYLTEYLQSVPKGALTRGGTFTVSVRPDGEIIVWIYETEDGSPPVQIFPKPANVSGNIYYEND